MKLQAAMVMTLMGLGPIPAGAQPYPYYYDRYDRAPAYEGLPMRAIVRAVRARGLDPVSEPRRRDRHYYVNAVDERGVLRQVTIDARTGRIVSIQAAGRDTPRQPQLRAAPGRFDEDRDYAMRSNRTGPAAIPDDDIGAEPPRSGATRPPLPPLRPRASIQQDPPRPLAGAPAARQPQRQAAVDPAPDLDGGPQSGALPPPPPAIQPSPGPRAGQGRSAGINPAPPMPRPRPAGRVAPPAETPAAAPAAQATQAANTPPAAQPESPQATGTATTPPAAAGTKRLPRIVLPGGPLPKAERTAGTRPGQREPDASATKPAEKPAQPQPSGVLPAQGFD